MANNKITRDDIISPNAFGVLKDYRKEINKAIKANKKLQKSIKKLVSKKYFYSPMCGFIQIKK